MAGRRMFARTVTTTGRFMRLSAGAKYLYFALGMEADDDGFAEGWVVLRMTGQEEADLRTLEKAGYVKVYGEDLITYIVDWDTNNQIRKDRYRESRYAYLLKEETEETPRKAVSSRAEKASDGQKTMAEAREQTGGMETETREMGSGAEVTRAPQAGSSLETAASHQGREGGTAKTAAAPQQDCGRGGPLTEGTAEAAASHRGRAEGAMETTAERASKAGGEALPARSLGTGGETNREKKSEMPEGDIDWAHFHPKTDEDLQLFAEHLREKRRQKRQREKEELIQKYGFYIDVDKILYGTDSQQEAAG